MRLRHEVWRDPEGDSFEFCIAARRADELRVKIAPRSELVRVIYAETWEEAMAQYHAWQGWDAWRPLPGLTDRVYDEEWLRLQQMEISRT